MERPAHIGSLAARLNNLEQKVDTTAPGGPSDTLIQRLYHNILGEKHSTVNSVGDDGSADFGDHPDKPSGWRSFYDVTPNTSLFSSIFGKSSRDSGPTFAALRSVQNPFYHQVFNDVDKRWLKSDPPIFPESLAEAVFGDSQGITGDEGYTGALRASNTSLAKLLYGHPNFAFDWVAADTEGGGLHKLVFGTASDLLDHIATHKSLLARIAWLEAKTASLQGSILDLENALVSIRARLAAGGL